MALWALTQERVDKLLKQIGDKELEIDELIKLSKEDLWNRDLDEFLEEWENQLLEEKSRQKRVKGTTRRVSSKLALGDSVSGIGGRKRKNDDDDDFEVKTKKRAAPKKKDPPKQSALKDFFAADSKPRVQNKPQVDGANEPKAAPKVENLSEDEEEVISKPASRVARTTATKTFKYDLSSDSDSDNGDDLLGDVSKMVKGIGASTSDSNPDGRTFFSASTARPTSSSGLKPATKRSKTPDLSIDADETDYSKLIPQQSPRRSILVTAKDSKMTDDEDEDDEPIIPASKPKPAVKSGAIAKATKAATKPAAKAARGKPKKEDSAPPKPQHLSPAAKAYAAKQAKSKRKILDDSDDDIDAMADDILDSPSSSPKEPVARPSRRAAATKKKMTYVVDDDSDDVESEESEAFSDSE